MRLPSYLLMLCLCLPGNLNPGIHPGPPDQLLRSPGFDWLLGDWQRTDDRPGRTTFEHWTKVSNSEYQGLSYTLRNSDTIFKEYMKLHGHRGQWILEVRGVNEGPTLFSVTKKARSSFTCENDKNEFPKFIEYTLVKKTLVAKISGAGQEVEFTYRKR